jgi:2-polyprenyl-3-methyl-5-hydroxy-6-metoxy-1,4-benzoquinol methylase
MNTHSMQPSLRGRPKVLGLLRTRIAEVLLSESLGGQGLHVDPEDPATPPPSTAGWSPARWRAENSVHMRLFADALRPPAGGAVRDGVIDDLADYYHLTPEQVIHRCLHWEDESVQEWRASSPDTPEGLAQFFNSVESWSFDLLWYSYLQTVGFAYPKHVVVADRLPPPAPNARLLDFGSGVGVTAQLFAALGYDVALADVSAPLLVFAQWRLEQRGVKATYIQLPAQLPEASYDVITALDSFTHVPDPLQTARELYQATRPGGYLVVNFATRRPSERSAWHLYDDDLPLRWAIERTGYVPVHYIDNRVWIYQALPTTGAPWQLHKARAWLRLASPPARGLRAMRHALARAALVTLERLRGQAVR